MLDILSCRNISYQCFQLQINFGFCKGDDNFGGRQRKELDDFTKSLGKQMTLVMYRMQDTENVRMRLREEGRRKVREKFEKEEAEDKAKVKCNI